MNTIPTAEEFEETHGNDPDMLIKFAKLHVEAALKAAHSNSQMPMEDIDFTLNAYPLTNII